MASNAERLIARTLEQRAQQGTPDANHQTESDFSMQRYTNERPNWDVRSLFQLDERRGANKPVSEKDITIPSQIEQPSPQKEQLPARKEVTPETMTYTSPFGAPKPDTFMSPKKDTDNSPFGSVVPQIKPELTMMEILNKPLTQLNIEDAGTIAKNLTEAVDSDYASIGGFFLRYKSEILKDKFPANKAMIAGLVTVPLTGLSAYALKSDVESFGETTSIGQKAYYATASAADATAMAGTIGTLIPRVRTVAGTTAALSFLARAGMGWTHSTFFPDKD